MAKDMKYKGGYSGGVDPDEGLEAIGKGGRKDAVAKEYKKRITALRKRNAQRKLAKRGEKLKASIKKMMNG